MNRVVTAEMLDNLPPADLRAVQSRRDLRRINFWMGNARRIRRSLLALFPREPPSRVAEIGSGDGSMFLGLARAVHRAWPSVEVTLIDRQPAISPDVIAEFKALGWRPSVITADVFEAIESSSPFDAISANLFLHHFQKNDLIRLLRQIAQKTKNFAACEPRRSKLGLLGQRLLWLIGCNEVTRNDAAISVRAGFRGAEISSLWPAEGWTLREESAPPFSHLFIARKCLEASRPAPLRHARIYSPIN